mmetsp:Transcript_13783/g.18658  ORF Transcript_13783/g.18658 Transcript_13783/m.18658 type:complete len:94 (-) Transcript_13783:1212-1493(-)
MPTFKPTIAPLQLKTTKSPTLVPSGSPTVWSFFQSTVVISPHDDFESSSNTHPTSHYDFFTHHLPSFWTFKNSNITALGLIIDAAESDPFPQS